MHFVDIRWFSLFRHGCSLTFGIQFQFDRDAETREISAAIGQGGGTRPDPNWFRLNLHAVEHPISFDSIRAIPLNINSLLTARCLNKGPVLNHHCHCVHSLVSQLRKKSLLRSLLGKSCPVK